MSKFYDGSGLLSHSQYKIFFSLGGRNIGKSTFWQRFVINHFIKYNEKFGIIVKYKDDLNTFGANYFSQDWMDKWFPDYDIMFKQGKYLLKEKNGNNWQLAGYCLALSMNASLKSTTTFQDIDNLLFEEFMPLEDRYIGSAKDPEKEPKLLTSVYQTIARGSKDKHTRKVRLICISNNYTMNNPYFTYFNILDMVSNNPNSIYQQYYTYDKGELHYCLEFSQLEPEMTGIEAEEQATGVKFSDFRNDLHYIKQPNIKDNSVILQLTFDGKYIVNIAGYNNSIIAYKGTKFVDADIIKVSCSKIKNKECWGMKAFKNLDSYKALVKAFEKNTIYYDNLQTFIQLTNILAW